jgi:two-component system nitrogen regulation response regulator NtrX
LRVIQELKFERIGGEKSIDVDVRLVAATNKDIQAEIHHSRFREDLFFRLNVVPIEVPPLRERLEDLPLLVGYFMRKFANGDQQKSISKEGYRLLKEYSWPGNIRELKNFVERINIMVDEAEISGDTVQYYLGENSRTVARTGWLDEFNEMKLTDAKNEFERIFIEQKLKENENNISKTAETLGIYPSNLHGKIKKLGIHIDR